MRTTARGLCVFAVTSVTGVSAAAAAAAGRDADGRPLYQRVESELDRGTGRIEDQQTYEVRGIQEPRLRHQSEFNRFEQERDRRQRIESKAQRTPSGPSEASASSKSTTPTITRETLETNPGPLGSPLARYVAEQEKLLDAARAKYQRDLQKAELERDEAIRTAKSRSDEAAASRRFDERRSVLTRAYQASRKKILSR
jgi:hypothetical protein